jgi:hypothetical protein
MCFANFKLDTNNVHCPNDIFIDNDYKDKRKRTQAELWIKIIKSDCYNTLKNNIILTWNDLLKNEYECFHNFIQNNINHYERESKKYIINNLYPVHSFGEYEFVEPDYQIDDISEAIHYINYSHEPQTPAMVVVLKNDSEYYAVIGGHVPFYKLHRSKSVCDLCKI